MRARMCGAASAAVLVDSFHAIFRHVLLREWTAQAVDDKLINVSHASRPELCVLSRACTMFSSAAATAGQRIHACFVCVCVSCKA